MSALGHKRTNLRGLKSAFVRYCPKADIERRSSHVRLVPIATNAPQQTETLFDHFVGAGE